MATLNVTPQINSADGPHYDEDLNILREENPEKIVQSDEEESHEEQDEEGVIPEEEHAEEEEQEEELEEEEEEEDEPVNIVFSRPSIKDINSKFPGFFKQFPQLKDVIFREAEYTRLYPTVEDAKEAFNDNEAYTALSEASLAGDPVPIMDSLEKTDKKAFTTFSASFLPALYKKSPETYNTVVTPLFENLLRTVHRQGDDNMKNSAINIATFLFGDDGEDSVLGKKTISKSFQPTEEQKRIKEESETRNATAFRTAAQEVSNRVGKTMRSFIAKDFDPEKVFSPFIREKLVDEIITKIDKKLNFDEGHKIVMSARWKRARQAGYNSEEKSKLVSTYLARAKSLIPAVREEVRQAALGRTSKANQQRGEKVKNSVSRREVNGGRSPRSGSSSGTKDYSKMSDLDILNS